VAVKCLLLVFQNISRLALQSFANRFQRGQPNCFCLAVFQDGDVSHGDADFPGELGNAHFPLRQHDVDIELVPLLPFSLSSMRNARTPAERCPYLDTSTSLDEDAIEAHGCRGIVGVGDGGG